MSYNYFNNVYVVYYYGEVPFKAFSTKEKAEEFIKRSKDPEYCIIKLTVDESPISEVNEAIDQINFLDDLLNEQREQL